MNRFTVFFLSFLDWSVGLVFDCDDDEMIPLDPRINLILLGGTKYIYGYIVTTFAFAN